MVAWEMLLAAAKNLFAWVWANVLDPRAWAVCALVFSFGFLRGCEHDQANHEALEKQRQIAEQAQHEKTLEINDLNRKAQREFSDASIAEMSRLGELLDAADLRLRKLAAQRFVPGPSEGPGRPVPESVGAQPPSGEIVCGNAERLDNGIRELVERFRERIKGVVREGALSMADADTFGAWGEQVGACPAPPEPVRRVPRVGPPH